MKRLLIVFSILLFFSPTYASDFLSQRERVAGSNRYETSVEASKRAFTTASHVIIASGESFPDALSGSALASSLDAPILLSPKDSLGNTTLKEIVRLNPRSIIILGSEATISKGVEDQLSPLAKVRRIGGANRYETSALIAQEVFQINGRTEVGLANGSNFPDALTATSYLDQKEIALLLTDGKTMPDSIRRFLNSKNISKVTVFGGENAVSSSILDGNYQVNRLAGPNRYETAIEIAKAAYTDIGSIILVNASNFPDALSATSIMQAKEAPIIMVDKDRIPDPVKDFILEVKPKESVVVGGFTSVSNDVILNLVDLGREEDPIIKPDLKKSSFNQAYAKDLAGLINKERASKGLNKLALSQGLTRAAETRAKEIASNLSANTRPDGSPWSTVDPKARAQFIVNLNAFPEDVMTYLKSVSGIFKERADFTSIGTASWTDDQGRTFWVIIYGLD